MSNLLRFGVSIESDLLESFDRLISDRGYANRSEALRDLIRDTLVQSRLEAEPERADVLGSLTLVYDHHAHDLTERMAELQHDHNELVVSVLHVHVSHEDCMEVIMLRGQYFEVKSLTDSLLSLKGIKHGKLFVTVPASTIAKNAKSNGKPKHDHKHKHGHNHKH